jgi:hypothetical protein
MDDKNPCLLDEYAAYIARLKVQLVENGKPRQSMQSGEVETVMNANAHMRELGREQTLQSLKTERVLPIEEEDPLLKKIRRYHSFV